MVGDPSLLVAADIDGDHDRNDWEGHDDHGDNHDHGDSHHHGDQIVVIMMVIRS